MWIALGKASPTLVTSDSSMSLETVHFSCLFPSTPVTIIPSFKSTLPWNKVPDPPHGQDGIGWLDFLLFLLYFLLPVPLTLCCSLDGFSNSHGSHSSSSDSYLGCLCCPENFISISPRPMVFKWVFYFSMWYLPIFRDFYFFFFFWLLQLASNEKRPRTLPLSYNAQDIFP